MTTKKTYTAEEAKIRGHQFVDEQANILRTKMQSRDTVTTV